MLIIGAHRINHGGFDGNICRQIQDSRSLRGNGAYGYGAYAYYADRIPGEIQESIPLSIFQPLIIRTTLDITHVRVPGLWTGNYHVRNTFSSSCAGQLVALFPWPF